MNWRTGYAEALEPRRMLVFPVGEMIRIEGIEPYFGSEPAIAMDGLGGFVVAFMDQIDDASGRDIFVRRYSPEGTQVGQQLQVNTFTAGAQHGPAIAIDPSGNFIVAWTSEGQDGSHTGVFARRYDASGFTAGSEFQVNAYTTSSQQNASVAMDSAGNSIIVWESSGQDKSGFGLYAKRYDSAGVALGHEFRINAYTTGMQRDADIAMEPDGDFVVAWVGPETRGFDYAIYARRFNASGAAGASEFRVDPQSSSIHIPKLSNDPSIAVSVSGDFMIAWHSQDHTGGGEEVFARRYSAAGSAQGLAFRVHAESAGGQTLPSVGATSDGGYLIAWQTQYLGAFRSQTHGQRYGATGQPLGSEFFIGATPGISQTSPDIGTGPGNEFVVTWRSLPDFPESGEVQIQRFGTPQVANGVLVLSGTPGNDRMEAVREGSNLIVNQNGTSAMYLAADVLRIEAFLGDGNDQAAIGPGLMSAYVLGGNGNDTLRGGDGNDSLVGASGKDSLDGGGGDDRVAGGKHGDVLRGGAGNDRVYGDEAEDWIDGGLDRDRIYGGDGDDTIFGNNQNDTIYGEGGNDSIDGGNHHDRIDGGTGSDTIFGQRGNDVIWGNDGVMDLIDGGADVDTVFGDSADVLSLVEVG